MAMMMDAERDVRDEAAVIAEQNDRFRAGLLGGQTLAGRMLVTSGVFALGVEVQLAAVRAVMAFDDFGDDNDPWGERDFGAVDIADEKLFWRIDLYAPDLTHGSEERANPKKTYRVLTIMTADEY